MKIVRKLIAALMVLGAVAALTVYDMCKAVQKDMVIDNIRLLRKTGGKSGDFIREEQVEWNGRQR